MEASEIGLAENAPNESEANPGPTGQPPNAQSTKDVTPPQSKPQPTAAADEEDPRTQTSAGMKVRNLLERIRETTVLQDEKLPSLESAIMAFFKEQ